MMEPSGFFVFYLYVPEPNNVSFTCKVSDSERIRQSFKTNEITVYFSFIA